MIFRRFSQLQARLILEKQDELREMEEELADLDYADQEKEPRDSKKGRLNRRHRSDPAEAKARQELFQRIEKKYIEYCKMSCDNCQYIHSRFTNFNSATAFRCASTHGL